MIEIRRRPTPKFTTPTDDGYSWTEVIRHRKSCGPITYLRLLTKSWLTVCAPMGTDCAMTNMYGQPLYRYKRLGKSCYLLEMEPSPGFPGN